MNQDWADDAETFKGQGAFITVSAPDGTYTDFNLTAEELTTVFLSLAK